MAGEDGWRAMGASMREIAVVRWEAEAIGQIAAAEVGVAPVVVGGR
jgi:hypothetical protein